MKIGLIIGTIVLLVVVGVGAFYAGDNYGQSQVQNVRYQFFAGRGGQGGGQGGNGGAGGQGGQFRGTFGTVKSIQGNTLTVTQQDGTTQTLTLTAQTTIQKTVDGTPSDLQPGDRITIVTDPNSTNVAQMIQIRPNTPNGQGGGRNGGQNGSQAQPTPQTQSQ